MDQEREIEIQTMLLRGAFAGRLENIKSLVELKGANINGVDKYSRSALHYAAIKGHSAIVEYLIARGANVEAIDGDGETPLFKAVKWRRFATAKVLVRLGAKTDTVNGDEETLLDFAIESNEVEPIHFLLGLEPQIFADQYGELLLESVNRGKLELIELLVESKGVSIDYVNKWTGMGALHCAAKKGHSAIVKYLVRRGANKGKKNKKGETPLFIAIAQGHVETAKILIELGANTLTETKEGKNILDAANMHSYEAKSIHFVLGLDLTFSPYQYQILLLRSAESGDSETVKLLVELKRVDINLVDDKGNSALHFASEKGHTSIVEYLVLKGAIVNDKNIFRETPLFLAVRSGHVETAKVLIQLGANTNSVDWDGGNLVDVVMEDFDVKLINFALELNLHISVDQYGKLLLKLAEIGDLETIKSLIQQKGADFSYINHDGKSALHHAASGGHSTIVEYLVLKGANLEAKDEYGETPLFKAAKWSRFDTTKVLIRLGAKFDTINKNFRDFIDVTVSDRIELMHLALEHGFDINQYDETGSTLLMSAVRSHVKNCVAFLLERGADYRKYSIPDGLSLLHLTMSEPQFELRSVIKLLIEHIEISEGEKGMLDYLDYNGTTDGQTALHLACINRSLLAVKLLLHSGANPDMKDKSGKVPYDYVSSGNDLITTQIRSLFGELQ